jgi:hypothetical protein
MAASVIIKHFTDGTITLKDGTGSPVTLAVPFSAGDLSLSGLAQDALGRATNAYESRGALNSLRRGAREYPTVSFSAHMADISDGSNTTIVDFLRKKGAYAANVSTTAATGDVYTVDIVLTVEGTDFGDASDHTVTMEDVDCRIDISEGEPNTFTVNGTVYGTITPA